jgi:hypothetical protein
MPTCATALNFVIRSGNLVVGAVKQQLSAEISKYVEKNPATNNKRMEITDVLTFCWRY